MITQEQRGIPWWFTTGIIAMIAYLVFIFTACGGGGGADVIVTDPADPPIAVEEPEPDNDPVIIAIHDYDGTRFYDGSKIWTWKTGHALNSGPREICHGTVFYHLGDKGETETSKNIIGTFHYAVTNGADLWQAQVLTAVESEALGAFPAEHTKIYKNAVEYGDWKDRRYKTVRFVNASGDICALGGAGGWRHINGTKTDIRLAVDDGVIIHDYNSTLRTAKIGTVAVSWSTNFMNSANFWQYAGGKWYSQNGYVFNGATLNEYGSTLTAWRDTQTPIPAGTRVENSETVMYWIECNTGWVYRYTPSVDTLVQVVRLYTGDGLKATGNTYAAILKPAMAIDGIYFQFSDGYTYRYKFQTGLTGYLTTGYVWIMGWN